MQLLLFVVLNDKNILCSTPFYNNAWDVVLNDYSREGAKRGREGGREGQGRKNSVLNFSRWKRDSTL